MKASGLPRFSFLFPLMPLSPFGPDTPGRSAPPASQQLFGHYTIPLCGMV